MYITSWHETTASLHGQSCWFSPGIFCASTFLRKHLPCLQSWFEKCLIVGMYHSKMISSVIVCFSSLGTKQCLEKPVGLNLGASELNVLGHKTWILPADQLYILPWVNTYYRYCLCHELTHCSSQNRIALKELESIW